MGWAAKGEGNREGKEELARGGWAEVARQPPVTALVSAFGDRFI